MTATAEQIDESLHRAATAVADWLGLDQEPGDYAAEREARRQIALAMMDGVTPAQIAAKAGVRQLLVAHLVSDHRARATALMVARHDAERYAEQVRVAIRDEALHRWWAATGEGEHDAPRGTKTEICRDLGITRPTLDAWIESHPEYQAAEA